MLTCAACGHHFAVPPCPRCGAAMAAAPASPAVEPDDRTVARSALRDAPPGLPALESHDGRDGHRDDATRIQAVKPPPVTGVPNHVTAAIEKPVTGETATTISPGAPSVGRVLNALCYLVTGGFIAFALIRGYETPWFMWLVALFLIGYGVKILVTRSSYWISGVIYFLPVFGVAYLWVTLSGGV